VTFLQLARSIAAILLLAGADTAPPPPAAVHTVRAGDTLIAIAGEWRTRSGHYSLTETLQAIRAANGLEDSNLLRPGQELTIPRAAAVDHPIATAPTRDGRDLRGIYLTGPMCGYRSVFARVDSFVAAGGNGVVLDAKDIDGGVSFRSHQPLAAWGKGRSAPVISDLPELLRRLHARDLYVVARLALFLDGELGRQRPDLALQGPDGEPWAERGCFWMDPAQPEVQAYNIALARELARAGVDEVQLDYVRFPTNGWAGDATGDAEVTAARRRGVIAGFLSAVADSLAPLGVKISADLYGIMAWERTADLAVTGQHVATFARYVDFLCPMIYPSHFGPGFEGVANPADHPEAFIAEGVRRFAEQADGRAAIRPWLQAFAWRVSDYDGRYVTRQIAAAGEAGAAGWCLWNPACRYETVCAALARPAGSDVSAPPVLAYRGPDEPAARQEPARDLRGDADGRPGRVEHRTGTAPPR